jgi:hypothetical protein
MPKKQTRKTRRNTKKRGGENECPPGTVLRKGYTRRFKSNIKEHGYTVRRRGTLFRVKPKKNEIYIPAACIKDRGLPGKGPVEGEGIGSLRKGKLLKYGYSYRLSDRQRHDALKRAMKAYGATTVYHMLDAVAKYSMRTAPQAHVIFKEDANWVRSQI